MQNKVYLDEQGFIRIQVVGDQSYATVQAMGEQIKKLAAELRSQGKPVLVYDDITQLSPKQRNEVGKSVGEVAKGLDFDRCAMIGKGVAIKYGANFIMMATGKANIMKFFDQPDQAVKWLQEVK